MSFCFSMQNFTEIRQSDAELWPKTIFKMMALRHREFLSSVWSHDCH